MAGTAAEKLNSLKNLLGGKDNNGVSAGELVNKLTPDEAGKASELKDKRGKDDAPSAFNALKDSADEEADNSASDPLSFLKKKKEEQRRAEVARLKGDPLAKGVNPLKESEEEEEDPALPRGSKKKKAKPESGAMARLALSLAEGEEEPEEAAEELVPEQAPGEDGEPPSARKALRAAKVKEDRDPLASLRDDPASDRGELNDFQGKNSKKEKLRGERKKAATAMQALLDEPLPETLPAEEEEALRAELGLKNRPDIPVKDLARKKRLKSAKSIKDRLAELNAELSADEESGEAIQGAISQGRDDEIARRAGDLSAEKLRGIRNAIDNEQTSEELEEERKRIKSKHESERKKAANKDKAIYIPEAEIQPLGNAWETTGSHYAYLASTVRYRGFEKLEDLLPHMVLRRRRCSGDAR